MTAEAAFSRHETLKKVADVPTWCSEYIGYIAVNVLRRNEGTEVAPEQAAAVGALWAQTFLEAVNQPTWPEDVTPVEDFYGWLGDWVAEVESYETDYGYNGQTIREYLGLVEETGSA